MSARARGGVLPFVIALGGHRDLRAEDVPGLEPRVTDILTWLARRYPNTPLLLLSSLAEGADRLGARVALRLGIGVVAAYRKIQRRGYGFFAMALVLAFAKPFLSAQSPALVVVPVVAALSQIWALALAPSPSNTAA